MQLVYNETNDQNYTLVNPSEWFGLVKAPNIFDHLSVSLGFRKLYVMTR